MTVMRLFFVASLTLFVGCSENKDERFEKGNLSITQTELNEAEEKLQELDQANVLNQLFSNSPEQDLTLMNQAIKKARSGINILKKFSGSKDQVRLAYDEFSTAIYLVDSFSLIQANDDRVNRVFNDVRALKSVLARDLGLPVETWVLYKHNFADGIEPEFRSPPGKDQYGEVKWGTNFQIDIPKAKVGARDGFAWMVSRSFDLSQVESPGFRFYSSYLVTAQDGALSLFEVIERVFQVYVILDLEAGESLENIPDERKIRMNYSPDEVPKAQGFHDKWLPSRSLEAYKQHKLSVAFLFDTRQIEFKQYYSWDIFDFEVTGAGRYSMEPYVTQPKLAENLGGYQSLSQVFSGHEWGVRGAGASIEASGDGPTEATLLSPFYAIKPRPQQGDASLALEISEELLEGVSAENAQIFISANYKVGQAFDLRAQDWTELKRESALGENQYFELTSWADKDFVLAFRFSSEVKKQAWLVKGITLYSAGLSLHPIPFLSPDANDFVEIVKDYNFLSDDYKLFKREYADGAPRWKKRDKGMAISGFRKGQDSLEGLARLISEELTLPEQSIYARFEQTISHIKGPGRMALDIQEVCEEGDLVTPVDSALPADPSVPVDPAVEVEVKKTCGEWIHLKTPPNTFRNIEKAKLTNWIVVPEKYLGKKVKFSFYYKGQGNNTPNWNLSKLQIAVQGGH